MKGMTTLGKVWNRVDELSRNCTDQLIATPDINFDNLKDGQDRRGAALLEAHGSKPDRLPAGHPSPVPQQMPR